MTHLLKSSEVMQILNCSKAKLRSLVADRKLYPLPDFKRWRFSAQDIEEYIEEQRAEAKVQVYVLNGKRYMNREILEMIG